MDPDGRAHLRWVTGFQVALLPLGGVLWGLLGGRTAALAFVVGGLASLSYWGLHWLLTARMLTPSVRVRWLYAFLSLGKLALIIVVLRVMIARYPADTLPLVTGVLLFVAGLLLEAFRLAIRSILFLPPD